ncbi:hypothetical protein TCE0_050r18352 [Talaromyces pinophilus]|uniref:Major facilitator superfamily (MFS) profile domain-containing protein n=1 Tax=Talaromyces pinophilus TaxID=128442 RepID=A0A0B8MYZ1_TALPI|nr:hypothetical protein TCE0_050r18352 [Talaromyces pinophilus]
MASIAGTEDVSRLIAQYFELVDLRNLTIPSSSVLKNPVTQNRIYNEMFNGDLLTPVIPPAAYRLRLLKKLIAVIENDDLWDPEEDEIIEPLMAAMTDLMSQPLQEDSSISSLDTEEPQLSFVSYTVPQAGSQGRKQITTYESRGLIYGSGSTGFRTWEAALHLGTYLSSVSSGGSSPVSVRGKRVVELGAGTGFLSLLCQKFLDAERVLMTDGNAKLVDVFNGPCLERNGFVKGKDAIAGRQWLWGEPLSADGTEEKFDIAFGADLTYDKATIPLLVDAISRLFSSHGVKQFVIAATIRNEDTFGAFLDACQDRHFVMEKSSFESPAFENQTGFFHSTQVPIWTYIEHFETVHAGNCDQDTVDKQLAMQNQPIAVDEETNKRLLRKVDWRLMPVMCFTYALQYYDKALLSQAAIFGLRKDLNLENGLRLSWVSIIFYFGYVLGCYPLSWAAQKFTVRKVCSITCLFWSIIILCTPACTSYAGILVNRFMLGVLESGVSPAFMLCVGVWYKHSEQVLRSSIWYSCSGGSLIISPIINYGLGHITGGKLHPWQYMYLIAGSVTFIWAILLWWILPSSPQDARGFTNEERILLLERVRGNNAGSENHNIKGRHLKEALLSYQFWCTFALSVLTTTPGGAISTYGSIIFEGMGFSTFESLLLNLPIGGFAIVCILSSGYLGRRLPNARLHLVTAGSLVVIIGSCMIWKLPASQRAARIIGYYLINFFSFAWVQCIAMGTSNVAGHTKKATMAAGTFVGFALGNIIGPLTFSANDAPRYNAGFETLVISFSICAVLAQVFRFAMQRQNSRRDQKYGEPSVEHGLEDLTDKENKSFRYHV